MSNQPASRDISGHLGTYSRTSYADENEASCHTSRSRSDEGGNYADGGAINKKGFTSPTVPTTPGHTIYGYLVLESSSSLYGDLWLIGTEDTSTAQYTYLLYYTGINTKPMTNSYLGVVEVHGILALESGGCEGLSESNGMTFHLDYLTQEQSFTNKTTQVSVINQQAWTDHYFTGNPYCTWVPPFEGSPPPVAGSFAWNYEAD